LGPDVLAKYVPGWKQGIDFVVPENLPPRPPVLCSGCPHSEIYKALKSAHPTFTTGDIGCYTLGASAPLNALDTCLCMGASISQAVGISNQGVEKVVAVIGDSTFIHSGVPALINAVYNKANILVMILDNYTTAMTGHQPTATTGENAKGEATTRVNIEDLCRACRVDSVVSINAYKVAEASKIIQEKLDSPGVNVVISSSPCLFVR
jgi:indolepyruvate ferredoxin oxidoreductase, alpha subunit